ncbi:GxxExxY protein [Roseimicrobium gellanilyticum]|uniref:GxxExxY protein n=1 Tax=Roseimicrobium gellanilyticum TaxID=748857 RepID=A0A366HF51_9BACT|nr:GxxExxY protein [Roseimicrobium gellanilyticum]RBP40539.1 GxxExxY protein [Roseimicrobium gellanilyticum]
MASHCLWPGDVTYHQSKLNILSGHIIGAAIEVHRELGPGLLESVYEVCLVEELRNRRLDVKNRLALPVLYKGRALDKELVVDIIVENTVILELKAVEGVLPVHQAQLLSYLRLTNKPLGLLLNFHVSIMTKGITRIVNDRSDVIEDAAENLGRNRSRG